MVDLNRALTELRAARGRTRDELSRLDQAISVLEGLSGGLGASKIGRTRPRLSAAARRRIAEAQKARWAKIRKQKAAG